ncbi:non-ribosomal peptide synthetase/type I polyketide synthase [Sphingobacterium kitahiroshimense]|uniref:Amino acid adenylation domain-containing protein n=1 Tax=Sphingobacterium kitahiroshimense TaxID=470446 RepID=A0ABV0BVE9_9SPHI
MSTRNASENINYDGLIGKLENFARIDPDRIAFAYMDGGEEVTVKISYQELLNRARTIAHNILLHVEPGERVLLLFPSGIEFIEVFFGCLYAGVIAIPAPPPLGRTNQIRLSGIINQSIPSLIITNETVLNQRNLAPILGDINILAASCLINHDSGVLPNIGLDTIAFLQYTSGSTSDPKGVIINHRNLTSNLISIRDFYGLECDNVVGWLPIYHDLGLIGCILGTIFSGCSYYFMSPLDFVSQPVRWLKAISKYKARISGGPNFAYELCVRSIKDSDLIDLDLSNWELAFNGAEPIRLGTMESFNNKFAKVGFNKNAFITVYGLAEATLFISGYRGLFDNLKRTDNNKVVSCGPVLPGIDVKIIEPESGRICKDGKVGEICISGPNVTEGYWNEKVARGQSPNKGSFVNLDNIAYLRTGDLGKIYKDEIFVCGRLKEVLIFNGQNYYPHDIEQSISKLFLDEFGTLGIAFSIVKEDVEKLVVVQELSRSGLRSNSYSEFVKTIGDLIFSAYQLPLYEIILLKPGSIPRTSSGKVQRVLFKNNYLKNETKGIVFIQKWDNKRLIVKQDKISDESIKNIITPYSSTYHIICEEILQIIEISQYQLDFDISFSEIGLTSLECIKLSEKLSQRLNKKIPVTVLYENYTIRMLAIYIDAESSLRKSSALPTLVENANSDKIAIVGVSCRFPGATNVQDFWNNMINSVDCISEIPPDRWDWRDYYSTDQQVNKMYSKWGGFIENISDFDASFFNITNEEACLMDPQQRILLELSYEAFENAGYSVENLSKRKVGVFIGASNNDYISLLQKDEVEKSVYTSTGNSLSILANRLSYFYNLSGPSLTVDTACSSSLVAVHLAVQSIKNAECTMAIAGGINLILSPDINIAFSQSEMLSADGRCKVFDSEANGYVRSEGGGLVVLKSLRQAQQDGDHILGVISGSAVNQDGRSSNLTSPNSSAQAEVIKNALHNAKKSPDQISFVETHGTGTKLGDPIELTALNRVYCLESTRQDPLILGSVKANIGHLESAAGIAGLIKALLCINHKVFPPQLHFFNPNPYFTWEESNLLVPIKCEKLHSPFHKLINAGVSSFGFGGVNVHMIIEEYKELNALKQNLLLNNEDQNHILIFSADSKKSLRNVINRILNINELDHYNISHLAFSLACHKSHLKHRLAIVCNSTKSLKRELNKYVSNSHDFQAEHSQSHRKNKSAFLFTGGGAQYKGMGKTLYKNEPIFRKAFDLCVEISKEYIERNLFDIVFNQDEDGQERLLDRMDYMQPGLFALEYATYQLWESWGVEPDIVLGHSLGEIVAACVAGIFSLKDAIEFVCIRGKLMHNNAIEGEMISVQAELSVVKEFLNNYDNRLVSISAINGPFQIIVGGEKTIITTLYKDLENKGIKVKSLQIGGASHSPLMDGILDELRDFLQDINFGKPQKNIISNLTGDLANESISTVEYWISHTRNTVQFAKGIETLNHLQVDFLIEIGPQPTLIGLVNQNINEDGSLLLLPSMLKDDPDIIYRSVATLFGEGATIKWKNFFYGKPTNRISLPSYPFESKKYWYTNINDRTNNKIFRSSKPLLELIGNGKLEESAFEIIKNNPMLTQQSKECLNEILSTIYQFDNLSLSDHEKKYDDVIYSTKWEKLRRNHNEVTGEFSIWILINANEEFVKDLFSNIDFKLFKLYNIKVNNKGDVNNLTIASELRNILDLHGDVKTKILYFSGDLDCNLESEIQNFEEILEELASLCHLFDEASKYELIKLFVITNGAVFHPNIDSNVLPLQGLYRGFSKSAFLEYPSLKGGLIDLPKTLTAFEYCELASYVSFGSNEDDVILREGTLYRQVIEKYSSQSSNSKSFEVDDEILITGGLGNLGLKTAKWFAEKGFLRIILLSRSATETKYHNIVEEFKNLGCSLSIVQSDISNRNQVQEVFENFPNIKIVIHSAGVLDDRLLSELNVESFEKVFSSKIWGTIILHQVSKNYNIKKFIVYSSLVSVIGNYGQANYSAASEFLNLFIKYRRLNKLPGQVINWGPWEAAGLVNIEQEKQNHNSGFTSLTTQTGFSGFEEIFCQDFEESIIANIEWEKLQNIFDNQTIPSVLKCSIHNPSFKTNITQTLKSLALILNNFDDKQRVQSVFSWIKTYLREYLRIPEENINSDTSLFDLGLDSLKLIGFRNKLAKELNISIPIKLIFEKSSLLNLTTTLVSLFNNSENSSSIKIYNESCLKKESYVPLSSMQNRLWFIDKIRKNRTVYNVCLELTYNGILNLNVLKKAFFLLIQKHESLRMSILEIDDIPYLKVHDPFEPSIEYQDLTQKSGIVHNKVISNQRELFCQRVIELDVPSLKVDVIKFANESYKVSILQHHIFTDGWSVALLAKELIETYDNLNNHKIVNYNPLVTNYSDYAIWESGIKNSSSYEEGREFWKSKLIDGSRLSLPVISNRSLNKSANGGDHQFSFSIIETELIKEFSKSNGITPFVLLLTAYAILLRLVSNQKQFGIGTLYANRNFSESENILGYFGNTVVIPFCFNGDESLFECIQKCANDVMESLEFQYFPIIEAKKWNYTPRDRDTNPLYNISFYYDDFQILQLDTFGNSKWNLSNSKIGGAPSGSVRDDLEMVLRDDGFSIVGELNYKKEYFRENQANHFIERYKTLIKNIVSTPNITVFSYYNEMWYDTLKFKNHPQAIYKNSKSDNTIVEMFEEQVDYHFDKIAVVFEDKTYSYYQLDQRSNQLAHYLCRLNVKSEVLVGVCMERSLELIPSLMGILKAGGAYLPIDPDYPIDRIQYMVGDSKLQLVLTTSKYSHYFEGIGIEVVLLDQLDLGGMPTQRMNNELKNNDLFYVIYTSGSTGRPKGVANHHEGVINRLLWAKEYFEVDPSDRILQKTTISFDVSVWELFLPLISGACVVLAEPGGHRDSSYLVNTINKQGITMAHFVPSMLEVFLQDQDLNKMDSLRHVICSGEELKVRQAKLFRERLGDIRLYNLYGPTEAAIDVTFWEVPFPFPEDQRVIPIGYPIPNNKIYILDTRDNLVPIGVKGEIFIGGIQIARGYINQSELTSERFVEKNIAGQKLRLYRSGDIGRWLEDGVIEFIGRADDQVKIRGNRVELNEVESVLAIQPGVGQCTIQPKEDPSGGIALIGYVVPQKGYDRNFVEKSLREKLPGYMVPSLFVEIENLPYTDNGKIDKLRLPFPSGGDFSSSVFESPGNEIEERLCEIWKNLLGIDKISIHDDFFELGGHSLIAMRAITQIKHDFNVPIPLKSVFTLTTINQIANYILAEKSHSLDLNKTYKTIEI